MGITKHKDIIQLKKQREISDQLSQLMYADINMLIAPYFWHQTSMEVSEKRISFSHGTAGGFHIVQDDEGINIRGQTKSGTAYLTLKCKEVREDKRPVTAPALSTILTLLAFISCSSTRRCKGSSTR